VGPLPHLWEETEVTDKVKSVWVDDERGYMLIGEAAQDYADGVALRRWCEAVAERPVRLTIGLRAVNRKGAYPYFVTATDGRVYYGHSIAEALDKCREALG
jgi:hypothetical protein